MEPLIVICMYCEPGADIEDMKYFESVCTFHVGFLNYLCSSVLTQGIVKCCRVMHITEKHQLS